MMECLVCGCSLNMAGDFFPLRDVYMSSWRIYRHLEVPCSDYGLYLLQSHWLPRPIFSGRLQVRYWNAYQPVSAGSISAG